MKLGMIGLGRMGTNMVADRTLSAMRSEVGGHREKPDTRKEN